MMPKEHPCPLGQVHRPDNASGEGSETAAIRTDATRPDQPTTEDQSPNLLPFPTDLRGKTYTFNQGCRAALEVARMRLLDGRHEFICNCICVAGQPHSFPEREARDAISHMLGRNIAYGGWLRRSAGLDCGTTHGASGEGLRLRGRLAWIDWMLEHHPLFANTEGVAA